MFNPPNDALASAWSQNPAVVIQKFSPKLDRSRDPVLKFSPATRYNANDEIPMSRDIRGKLTIFRQAEVIEFQGDDSESTLALWPPLCIPAIERTEMAQFKRGNSKNVIQLRQIWQWSMMSTLETYETVSRLLPDLYTPDFERPLRGLWVGDYELHGGEFILFHQPAENSNRLEAIKLTGDPNVPRGESSFIVDDLSHCERISTETEWFGAPVVKAKGQIAQVNFINHQFTPAELIIISKDRVALYWIDLNQINIYVRVQVDELLAGEKGIR